MPPKLELITAETTSFAKPSFLGRRPYTTKEKLEYHAWKESQAKAQLLAPPPESPENSKMDAPGKKSKTKLLPPPDEMAQAAKEKRVKEQQQAKLKAIGAGSKRRRPITTKEKIQAERKKELKQTIMRSMKKAKNKEAREAAKEQKPKKQGTKKAEEPSNTAGGKPEKKQKQYQQSDLSRLTFAYSPTAAKYTTNETGSVLVRPTERAKQERRVQHFLAERAAASAAAALATGTMKNASVGKKKEEPFPLMELPEELRTRIWRLAVVYTPFAVWPGQKRGREQPDLAMSGREIRGEVLGCFYGGNVFGVDVTPLDKVEEERVAVVESTASKDAGLKAAEENRVGVISEKKQDVSADSKTKGQSGAGSMPANSQQPRKPKHTSTIPDPITEIELWARALEPTGHLNHIRHWLFSSTPELPGRVFAVDATRTFVVYLNLWRECGVWRANVEVHREACCVLPGAEEYGKCVIQSSPAWLNTLVGLVLAEVGKKGMTARMVMGVARALRDRAEELAEVRCSSHGAAVGPGGQAVVPGGPVAST